MSEEFNNKPSLAERLKDLKVNRSAVISACVLVAAVVIVSAVAIANNRAKKNDNTNDPGHSDTQQTDRVDPPADTQDKQPETQAPVLKPEDTPSKPVVDTLPSFILPVSGSLIKHHTPDEQVYSDTMNDYRVHLGIDIATEQSAAVYAAADGKIERIWEDTLMGNCMVIKHGGNSYTIYKNLSATLPEGISEGTSVRAGQLIASVGESAMTEIAEEPHLHFEMTVADLGVDPLKYFDEKALETLKIDASYGE